MKQEQVITHKNLKINNHNLLERVKNHCYFNELRGNFICKKSKNVVNVEWSRDYAYCANHGMI